MRVNRRAVFVFSLFLCAICPINPGSAQSNLSDRVWKATNSVLVAIREPKAKVSLWRFGKPVSFTLIDVSATTAVEDLIRGAVLPSVIDEDCIAKVLERLATDVQPPSIADSAAVTQVEGAFLKERSLTNADLNAYKTFRDKYASELRRVGTLSPEKAQAESFKLKQIETEWETLGRRSDFVDLEGRISKLAKSTSTPDVTSLRNDIYDGSNKLNFRLSVPISQWNQYDSWVHVKKMGADQTALPRFKVVDIPTEPKFNADSCAADSNACTSEVKGFLRTSGITVSVLAPQFDLPWLTKFLKAASGLRDPVKSCATGTRLDRLVLVQAIGTSFDTNQMASVVQLIASKKSFGEDGLQFSGVADLGLAYYATPIFAGGMVMSPHSYLIGFTTSDSDATVK